MTSLYLWKEITDLKMPDEEKRMTKRLVYGHSCFTVDLVCFLIIKISGCRDIKFVSWIFVLSLFRRKLDSIITKLYHATPLGRENLEEKTNTVKCLLCCQTLRERSHLPYAHAHVLIEMNLGQSDGLMTGAICIQINELPSCNSKVALTLWPFHCVLFSFDDENLFGLNNQCLVLEYVDRCFGNLDNSPHGLLAPEENR